MPYINFPFHNILSKLISLTNTYLILELLHFENIIYYLANSEVFYNPDYICITNIANQYLPEERIFGSRERRKLTKSKYQNSVNF